MNSDNKDLLTRCNMRSDEPETITARPKQSELLEWLVPRTDPIDLSLILTKPFYPQ